MAFGMDLRLGSKSGYNHCMKVMVGVSGGVAAYKAVELVRSLQRHALEVRVTMTQAATRFVQPLTFAAISGHRVMTSLWEMPGEVDDAAPIDHIAEAQWADLLVVAPATADILARFAHGIADDFLTTMYLATPAPVVVAPAMNSVMWEHAATQANVDTLRQRGVRIVEPDAGQLACGMVGPGRMAEPEQIANAVLNSLGRSHDLAGEVVLITAAGTREALDPVRFLGNRSSGKMGYALAEAAQSRGARVILITGPSALHPPFHCEVVRVTTAEEMRAAVLARQPEATVVIKSAAVADYRPVVVAEQKIRRQGPVTLELLPTEDILAEVVRRRTPGQLIVGFAAETEDSVVQGRAKLLRKGADAIVVNDVGREDIGFDSDNNAATFLTLNTAIDLPFMPKRKLADRILDEIVALRRPQSLLVELSSTELESLRSQPEQPRNTILIE